MPKAAFALEGVSVDYTPAAAVAAGDVVVRGALPGVSPRPIAAGEAGSLQIAGAFDFAKLVNLAINAGENVYWDPALLTASKVTTGVRAFGTLTIVTAVPSDGETVTIGTTVYTFRTTPSLAYEVDIGATIAAQTVLLENAINANGVPGVTTFGAGTLAHPQVTATSTATTVVVTAIDYGTPGNAIATTETMTNGSWGAATLASGAGGVLLGLCVKRAEALDTTVRVSLDQT